ncbi:hypothetical protein [Microvirga sp. VF16]|uniref:hypothetical protein n=1 Tax=Microvirga sp. VF16 TaxID=2807101 RepID=UPI00193DF5C7|nr:hypothetical protein [Microvirga sp. VF16]QRM32479.1 hypothetical protein JO965_30770 [Microvirga sp. VF16]
MWKLFYPLRYFRLKNDEKRWLDWIPTLVLTLIVWAPFAFVPGASFFRPDGFLDKFLGLAGALTGFYVAALVAAATFAHPDLDKTIRSGPIALIEKDSDGRPVAQALTRREFACTVFGYLAFAAFAVSLFSAIAVGVSEAPWAKILGATVAYYVRAIVALCFSLGIAHMTVATCLGLYYMMDRLYRSDRQIISRKISA